jgi:hypothetical protein
MKTPHKPVRNLIRQSDAETNLLVLLFSFAGTISITRLFLYLTRYPQIGGSELHVAHVLWGGFLFFIATILPILYSNRRIYTVEAILAGIGAGLFFDEIGKFITRNNDYFYPPAAPIIYLIFLITVLVYILVHKHPRTDIRTNFYYILSDLEEVIDQDLSPEELESIKSRLNSIVQNNTDPNLKFLAQSLSSFLNNKDLVLVPEQPGLLQRIKQKLEKIEGYLLDRKRLRLILISGMITWSAWQLTLPVKFVANLDTKAMEKLLQFLIEGRIIRGELTYRLFIGQLGLRFAATLLVLMAAIFLIIKMEKHAVIAGYVGLLISITIVNLFDFYFDQFSTIIDAGVQLILLIGLIRYRDRFVRILNPKIKRG